MTTALALSELSACLVPGHARAGKYVFWLRSLNGPLSFLLLLGAVAASNGLRSEKLGFGQLSGWSSVPGSHPPCRWPSAKSPLWAITRWTFHEETSISECRKDSTQGVARVQAATNSSAAAAAARAIKDRLANLWPLEMLGLGLVLTVAWDVCLLWLFVSVI